MPSSTASGTPWGRTVINEPRLRRPGRLVIAALLTLSVLPCHGVAAQTASASAPSLGAVFREVPGDLWHFISWDTAAVLGIGGGAAAIGHIWDDDFADEIDTNPTLNNAMEPGHTYGAFSAQVDCQKRSDRDYRRRS